MSLTGHAPAGLQWVNEPCAPEVAQLTVRTSHLPPAPTRKRAGARFIPRKAAAPHHRPRLGRAPAVPVPGAQ